MAAPTYSGYRFPRDVIQRAVWMYVRFTLSYRDVEDLLAERGIEVSYETVRRWVLAFGPVIARRLRARRPKPHCRWHLDEMFVRIGGRQMYLWRPSMPTIQMVIPELRLSMLSEETRHDLSAEARRSFAQLFHVPQNV